MTTCLETNSRPIRASDQREAGACCQAIYATHAAHAIRLNGGSMTIQQLNL